MSDGNTGIQVTPAASWPSNEDRTAFSMEDEMTVRELFTSAANAVVNASKAKSDMEATIALLRSDLERLRQDLADMRDNLTTLVRERAEAVRERDEARRQHALEKADAERLAGELATARDDCDLARMERDDWHSKFDGHEISLANVCNVRDSLLTQLTAAQEHVRRLEEQNVAQADTIMRAYEWADGLRVAFGTAIHPNRPHPHVAVRPLDKATQDAHDDIGF